MLSIATFGPEAGFSLFERQLIEPSLTRLFERTSPTAFETAGKALDPLLLIVGAGLWGARILKLGQKDDGATAEEPDQA